MAMIRKIIKTIFQFIKTSTKMLKLISMWNAYFEYLIDIHQYVVRPTWRQKCYKIGQFIQCLLVCIQVAMMHFAICQNWQWYLENELNFKIIDIHHSIDGNIYLLLFICACCAPAILYYSELRPNPLFIALVYDATIHNRDQISKWPNSSRKIDKRRLNYFPLM